MDRRTKRILGWAVTAGAVAGIIVAIVALTSKKGASEEQSLGKGPTITPGGSSAGSGTGSESGAVVVPGELVEERTRLSEAIFSGKLAPAEADAARSRLWELAQKTIFSPQVYAGDPYTFAYEFKQGERLADGGGKPGLVSTMDLQVPAAAIEMANKISAPRFEAGRKYKMIRGPFHAVVYKSAFAMDIYLQRGNGPKTFIRRVAVGLGKDGSTPLGGWIVTDKNVRTPWYPPKGSGLSGLIRYGEKDYAFGKKGLWIKITGIDDSTRGEQGYGIHSTSDPSSIGKETSLGCIRLRDEDIDFVFNVLFRAHSTVWVRP